MDEWVKQMYKSTNGFGDNNQENRREIVNERRRTNRETAINKRRNIPLNLSPMTPKHMETVQEEPPKKVNDRLEMLKKWKQEKEKKKLELKKQQKPMFKWSKVEHKDDFNVALHYIKGRKIAKEIPKNEHISTLKSSIKKPITASSTKCPVKKNCRNETPLVAGSDRSKPTAGFKNASGSGKITCTSESKTSARRLKFPSVTSKSVNSDGIPKSDGISLVGKAISATKVKSVQGSSTSNTATEPKSLKKVKTPKKPLKQTEISGREVKNGVGESSNYSKENLSSFPNESEISRRNNSFTLLESSKQVRKPKKSFKNAENATNMEEMVAKKSKTPSSSSKRHAWNVNSYPGELVENNSVNNSLTVQNSTGKGELFRKSLNNSKILTPTMKDTEANMQRLKTPRSSTTKKSIRTSRVHVNFEKNGADVGENNEILRKSFVRTPKIESKGNAPRIKTPHSSVTRKSTRTPRIGNNGLEETSSDVLRKRILNTSNAESKGNVSRIKTPRSSATKKSTRTPGVDNNEAAEKNSDILRQSIFNTPNTDWKLVVNENYESSSKKPRSLRKSLAIKTLEKNHVTPNKSDEDLAAVSESFGRFSLNVPKSPGFLSNSRSSPNLTIDIPSSSNRRKSKIPIIEVEKENKTPKTELIGIDTAKRPRSVRKSLGNKINSAISTTKQRNNGLIPEISVSEDQEMEFEKDTISVSPSRKSSIRRRPAQKSEGSDYLTPLKSPSEINSDVFITPERANDDPVVYVSPFVTTSRGKKEAIQEFKMRKSMDASNTSFGKHDSAKSPRAAAAYFTRILDAEIERLREKCNIWEECKNSGTLSEDACGLIDMTIGQTNLLISEKFNQFRGLIEECRRNNETEMRIECEDLHGFWDMIYKQVNDLNKRFANLQEMKDNNWLEEAPKKKTPKKIVKKKRNRMKPAPTSSSSVLKETILAARKKLANSGSQGDVEICIVEKKLTRNIEKDCTTPGRGILKSQNTKSEKRKTVAFKDLRTSKSASKNTPNQPVRRSLRLTLSGTKLNFE